MIAVVQSRYGSPDVLSLANLPVPAVGDDDILIQVHAAGVHIGDVHVMTGTPRLMRYIGFGFRGPKARVRGMDMAGTVVAVGARVNRFKVGDAVYGTANGSFAEYAVAREGSIALKPTSLSFEEAAAVPTSACTALHALRTSSNLQAGQRVLIIGASGGVGLFAVQIAKAMGAVVTGVSSAAKAHLVRTAGADRVLDYAEVDYLATGPYDLIIDSASTHSLRDLLTALVPSGTLTIVGGESGGSFLGGLSQSLKAMALSPFVSQNLRMMIAVTNSADLQTLTGLLESADVRPIIDRTYPLSETAEALRYLMSGKAAGKIVIDLLPATSATTHSAAEDLNLVVS